MRIYSDAPITGGAFDVLGRVDVARRLLEVLTLVGADRPVTLGLVGPTGCGKTSVLHMTGELLAERSEVRAFVIDAWAAGDAARVNDTFLREIARIFSDAGIVGGADKVRDRLTSMGDMVSSVARFAGVKLDVKGALERSPDELRNEVMKLTEELGKRIVVFVDHLDRLTTAETVATLRKIERWGTFPYFAFVLAFDRVQLVHTVRHVDGDADALDRIVATEIPLPAVDRAQLAAWVRGGLADLGQALTLDPEPALALFDLEDGLGLGVVKTLRDAKHLLNTLVATMPLNVGSIDLRTMCLLELARRFAPAAYQLTIDRMPLDGDRRSRLASELQRATSEHAYPHPVAALVAALAEA